MKKIVALLLAVTIMFSLVGCTKTADAKKEDGLTDIKIAEFRGLTWSALYVAYQNGYFQEEGLNPELLKIDDGPNAFQGMHAGEAEFCIISQEVPLKAQEKGIESVFITTMLKTRYYAFVGGKGITSIDQLKGQNVFASTPGSAPYTFCLAVLREAGLEPGKDVTLVQMNKGAVMAALDKGEVKAAFVNMDNYVEADNVEGLTYLVDTRREEDVKKYLKSEEFPGEVIAVTKKFCDENPQTVQSFVNAIAKGVRWIEGHSSAEVANLISPLFSGMKPEILEKKIEVLRGAMSSTGYISEEGQKAVENMAIDAQVIKSNFKYSDIVRMEFVEKAYK